MDNFWAGFEKKAGMASATGRLIGRTVGEGSKAVRAVGGAAKKVTAIPEVVGRKASQVLERVKKGYHTGRREASGMTPSQYNLSRARIAKAKNQSKRLKAESEKLRADEIVHKLNLKNKEISSSNKAVSEKVTPKPVEPKPVKKGENGAETSMSGATAFIKKHKKPLIAAAAGGTTVVAGNEGYKAYNNKKQQQRFPAGY